MQTDPIKVVRMVNEPTVDDVKMLRRALTNLGWSAPESDETLGFEWMWHVRRVLNDVARADVHLKEPRTCDTCKHVKKLLEHGAPCHCKTEDMDGWEPHVSALLQPSPCEPEKEPAP